MDGDIRFNVGANTAQFDAGMAGVANSANTAAAKIKNAFSGLGGILAGGAALAGLKTLMNDLDAVAKMSTRFNTSAESIQRVSLAADLAGTSIDVVAQAMQKVGLAASKATLEGGTMAETFQRAGLDAQAFNKANLDEKLLMVARAFEAARGNADRTNAIIELLGSRSAGQLIPLLSNVEALQAEMANAAVVSDDFVWKVEAANDRMTRLGNTMKVAFAGGLEGFTQFSERIGSLLSGAGGKTIAEMEADEMRANAEARLRARGELLPDDTQTVNRGAANPTRRDFEEGTAWKEIIPGPNAEENVRRINAELQAMRAELAAAEESTTAITAETDEQISKNDERKQQMQQLHALSLQIKEAQAEGNQALADDLAEYKALVEAAIKYEGDLEMAARDVNTAHKERLRLQNEALQKSIAQVEKEVELAETMAFGSDEAKKKAEWMKVYADTLEKTGREDLARRAANAATAEETRTGSNEGGAFITSQSQTDFDRLSELARDFNPAAMRDLGRIGDRTAQMEERADELARRGMHGSAANLRARAEKRRQEEAAKALERMGQDAAKPEAQRKQEEEQAKAGKPGAKPEDSATQIYNWLKDTFMREFQDRLPQTAMTA